MQAELDTLKSRFQEISRNAWPWYSVLGFKLLLHDRILQRVLLHQNVLARYSHTLSRIFKKQSTTLDTEIENLQVSLRAEQEKIDSLDRRSKATDERVKQYSEALSRTASQSLELSSRVSNMQPAQILSSFTSATFKFTKRFEDVFSDLDNHKRTIECIQEDIKNLHHRTVWMVGSSEHDRMDRLEQNGTIALASSQSIQPVSTLVRCRSARRSLQGIPPSASGGFLPPKIQHFEDTSASLDRRIREHEQHMQDWMTAIEKRFTTQHAGLAGHADDEQHRPSAEINIRNSSIEQLDEEKIKELLEKKLKAVVTQSKNKFDVHEARITALEKDVYKPAQQTLPVGDRLDNLEYDAGNALGQLKELTAQMSDTVDSVSSLHNLVDNLRLDRKNLGKKGNDSTYHEFLQSMKRAIKLVEEHHGSAFTKIKEFEERMVDIERAVNQIGLRLMQTSRHPDMRVALEDCPKEAHDALAVSFIGLKQRLDEMRADMLAMDTKIMDCLRVIDIFGLQPEPTPMKVTIASNTTSDFERDIVSRPSDTEWPPTPSSFSAESDGETVVRLPAGKQSSEAPSIHMQNSPSENIDTASSPPVGTVFDPFLKDIGDLTERFRALKGDFGSTAFVSSTFGRVATADEASSGSLREETVQNNTGSSARQLNDGSIKRFRTRVKTWVSFEKNTDTSHSLARDLQLVGDPSVVKSPSTTILRPFSSM
ncbi:hypothetical protein QFC22_002396 [Naganishia vaughanmartiniae]|uniref:Uncharacterized protein n=1 Tax=Naganishia vaughanmartiniae TaxID=1424756 RepID=A0ACC2XEB9_9TREE|nr:hypothetical protein QFC22_002396 [Naganishia vaughanmartiniae]